MNKKDFYFKVSYVKDAYDSANEDYDPNDIEITAWENNGPMVDDHVMELFPELEIVLASVDPDEVCEGTIMVHSPSKTPIEIKVLLENAGFTVN